MVLGTTLGAIAMEYLPELKTSLLSYPLIGWLLDNMSLYAPEVASFIIAYRVGTKLWSKYDSFMSGRNFVKEFAKDREIEDMAVVASKIAKHDYMKANICYSILWKKHRTKGRIRHRRCTKGLF